MSLWSILLLTLFAVGESQSTAAFNQTDLQTAMSDMRSRSYYGFVILLKILNSLPNQLQSNDFTFLMPNDEDLSHFSITTDELHDFLLSHSIPTALLLSHLLHFPNGSIVPSGLPNKVINITNSGRAGLFVNNARVVTPNVCLNSLIRCHGISAAMTFENVLPFHRVPKPKDPSKKKNNNDTNPTRTIKNMSIPPFN
ncbi:uncharacterized protein LOC123920994 [Trifolium pratense]|uniref:uncharacterized protein LOC123920994 n=1 Tax=Trifolium pratense TaxID=57577 RepID=UPI001E69734A|nr:uncharacterized protein LOC123920994 [Trifolium pratense]